MPLSPGVGLKRSKHARSQVLGLCTVWHELRKNAKGVYGYYLFCRRPCSDFESDMCFATSIDFVMPPATDPRGNVTRRKQKWQRVAGPHRKFATQNFVGHVETLPRRLRMDQ